MPLHTLRANIDYGRQTAHTPYGTCGIKVWVFRGEIMEHDPMAFDKRLAEHGRGARLNGGIGIMLSTETDQIPQGAQGPDPGLAKGGAELTFGAFGMKALEPERVTARQIEAARRAITRHSSASAASGSAFSGQADLEEARRGAHGQGQGLGRVLGGRGQARPNPVRDRRRARGPGGRGDRAGCREAADPHQVRDTGRRGRWRHDGRGGTGRTADQLPTSCSS